mmetsp:Transcript_17047/g.57244  ORF Transcript_17047/g.57244 Transcript_17047/m.57244 type:complete len:282 (-) Transcript_17047:177-1022(-)
MPRNSHRRAHEDAYTRRADLYESLCDAQQLNGVLDVLRAVQACRHRRSPFPADDYRVVDVGTGSGKLATRLAPYASSVVGVDREVELLAIARRRADALGLRNCAFLQGDCRSLPLPGGSADLIIAGWVLCYLKVEHERWDGSGNSSGPWREEVDRAIVEMERVLRPGGLVVLLESRGTAATEARRGGSRYYEHLRYRGFREELVRTDYAFASREEATDAMLFFFGRAVAQRAEDLGGASGWVPEVTGLWWRRRAGKPAACRSEAGCAAALSTLDALLNIQP